MLSCTNIPVMIVSFRALFMRSIAFSLVGPHTISCDILYYKINAKRSKKSATTTKNPEKLKMWVCMVKYNWYDSSQWHWVPGKGNWWEHTEVQQTEMRPTIREGEKHTHFSKTGNKFTSVIIFTLFLMSAVAHFRFSVHFPELLILIFYFG